MGDLHRASAPGSDGAIVPGQSVGKFRLGFTRLQRPYGVPYPPEYEYTATVDVHIPVKTEAGVVIEDVPRPGHNKPWEGELSLSELQYVLTMPGSRGMNQSYRFTVQALDGPAKAAMSAELGVNVDTWPPVIVPPAPAAKGESSNG